ncbi:MAG: NFACT RNA binding domain-containing protein [Planctomycetota bacterium]
MKIKRFQSSSGLEILVGQDDASNDQLTFTVAHQNDVWLHVAGAPGSHVVLRCGESRTRADKQSIKEAAALAAWFSKLRAGGKVSVHYCLARNVKKPRGYQPGQVQIEDEQAVLVRPALLPGAGR